MQWDLEECETLLETIPFNVQSLKLKDKRGDGPKHPYYRLQSQDWVNIVPVTVDGQVVLIRQSRAGSWSDVLEVPGGMMDEGEKDPTMAAVRELEEETGFTSQRILPLANINPNPAIMTNRLHMFLALGCQLSIDRKRFPDDGELIKVELYPFQELDDMVRRGEIDSCLAALSIMLAKKYVG